jgi:hypothetical protein
MGKEYLCIQDSKQKRWLMGRLRGWDNSAYETDRGYNKRNGPSTLQSKKVTTEARKK